MTKLESFYPPFPPDHIQSNPNELSKWNEYWEGVIDEWDFHREQESRDARRPYVGNK